MMNERRIIRSLSLSIYIFLFFLTFFQNKKKNWKKFEKKNTRIYLSYIQIIL